MRIRDQILYFYLVTASLITFYSLIVNKGYFLANKGIYITENNLNIYTTEKFDEFEIGDFTTFKISNGVYDYGEVINIEDNNIIIANRDDQDQQIIFKQDIVGIHYFTIRYLGFISWIITQSWFFTIFLLLPCMFIISNSFHQVKDFVIDKFYSFYPIVKYKTIRFMRKNNLKW